MIRALLTILFISSFLNASIQGQTLTENVKTENEISLEGILRDMNLDEYVPFGKVALYQNEKLMYGEDTDMSGQYKFSNIANGTYQVKASFYGYDFVNITEVKIETGKQNITDLELKVTDELYAPISVVGKEVIKEFRINVCSYTYHSITTIVQEKVEREIEEIDARSKPGPFKRDPYDTPSDEDLLLYPNPSTGPITIELDFEQLHIELINALGQVLGSVEYNEIENDMVQIDLSTQAAGTYFLSITYDGGTHIEKVVIAHL